MSQVSSVKNFESLCKDMKNGNINNLIILGANPVYDSPVDFDFAESLKNKAPGFLQKPSRIIFSSISDDCSRKIMAIAFLDFDFWPTDGRFVPKSDLYGFSRKEMCLGQMYQAHLSCIQ